MLLYTADPALALALAHTCFEVLHCVMSWGHLASMVSPFTGMALKSYKPVRAKMMQNVQIGALFLSTSTLR